MHTRTETLNQVIQLLEQVPGVTVQSHRLIRRVAQIEFEVQSSETAAALERIAQGANVAIKPGILSAHELPSGSYMLVASAARRDGFDGGELQLLGIHLAWHLHKVGVLGSAQANALLKPWRGARVGV